MKIVKLNRRYTIHRVHGFEVALRFDQWGTHVTSIERIVRNLLGEQAWMWKYDQTNRVKGNWASGFGQHRTTGSTPYWIYLRKESSLSAVLLSLDANNG